MRKQKNKPTTKELENSRLFRKVTPVVVIIIVFSALTWWMFFSVFRTHPLGDKLEYIAKEDYGCYFPLCASKPGSTYYYATDMEVEDIVKYFKQLKLGSKIRTIDDITDFHLKSREDDVHIHLYKSDNQTLKQLIPVKTEKTYIVSIPHFDYELAKSSL